jgi:hypothetical protein
MFVMLNPSTAGDTANDPTVRRCMSFASGFGCGGLVIGNLFGLRATDPLEMMKHVDPVGRDNDYWLLTLRQQSAICVAAWGARGGFLNRDRAVSTLLGDMMCLGLTKAGLPRHPLYLSRRTELQPYSASSPGKKRGVK